jgi:NAD-dependent SIR2 family protein deacetylase
MKVLIFAGAGTSIELGVPGMRSMAQEFTEHSHQWNVEPELVKLIMDQAMDVEFLVERLDAICSAKSPLALVGYDVEGLTRIEKIRAEVEWFVQHAAERVVPKDAWLMWGSLLRLAGDHDFTIVTTNYDRAIELAANIASVALDDGFTTFGDIEMGSWAGYAATQGGIPIVKLHGSTDWYTSLDTGAPVKLRHPMPLFGRAAIRLQDGLTLGSALVLPSREKILTKEPFPDLSQSFLNAAAESQLAVFIGTSLRDPHVRSALKRAARHASVFVVTPDGVPGDIGSAVAIRQPASVFLNSTLPTALRSPDPITVLHQSVERKVEEGILADLQVALDRNLPSGVRLASIDRLDGREICLDYGLIQGLIVDLNPAVSRYAFGLAALSPDAARLLELAKQTPHNADLAFSKDLELFDGIVAKAHH